MSLKDNALSRLVSYRQARNLYTAALQVRLNAKGKAGEPAAVEALAAADKVKTDAHNAMLQAAELYERALPKPP